MSLKLFNSVENKIYQKIFVFVLFFLPSYLTFSQVERSEMTVYEYNKTTEKAIKELYSLVGDDKLRANKILSLIEEFSKNKIYVLSTEEYLPIKNRIDYFNNNYKSFSTEDYKKEKDYTSKLSYKYRVITELIKMEP